MLKLRFDVSQYQPEEIVVKTVDNKLLVSTNWPGEMPKEKPSDTIDSFEFKIAPQYGFSKKKPKKKKLP